MSYNVGKINWWVQRILPEVYDSTLSHYELLNLVMQKLNEVIDSTNNYFSQDLKEYVSDILGNWKSTGELATIINQEIFDSLNSKINNRAVDVDDYVNKVIDLGQPTEDWYPAFLEAINSVKTTGGKIFVRVGRKRLAQSINLPSYVAIEGMGEKSELWTDVPNLNLIVSEVNAQYCQVLNLKVTGSGYGTQPPNSTTTQNVAGAGSGIIFRGVLYGRVEKCHVINHGGDGKTSDKNGVAGVWLTYGTKNTTVIDNVVETSRNGINEDNFFYQDSMYNLIERNTVLGCRFGIASETDNGKGTKIKNNTIKNCIYSGIDINRTSLIEVVGNYLEANGNIGDGTFASAINAYGSQYINQNRVMILNNILKDNYGWGIKISQNNNNSKAIGNQIAGGAGILVQGARYYKINNNEITDSNNDGIHVNEMLVGSTTVNPDSGDISQNHINGAQGHGIYMSQAYRSEVSQNRIYSIGKATANTSHGISLNNGTSNGVFTGNIIDASNSKYGIAGVDGGSQNNVIANNRVITVPMTAKYGYAGAQYESNNN